MGVNGTFWAIIYPLSNYYFFLIAKVVTSRSLSFVVHPVTLKIISVVFCQKSIAISFAFSPLTYIYILVVLNHSTKSRHFVVFPKTVISISVRKIHGPFSPLCVVFPLSIVLTNQLLSVIHYPKSSFSVSFVVVPLSFVSISILINFRSKSRFLIIFPISFVFGSDFERLP